MDWRGRCVRGRENRHPGRKLVCWLVQFVSYQQISEQVETDQSRTAIQFAVLAGFEVITTSSPAHSDYLKSLGATTVIDRSAPDVAAQILVAAGGAVKYVVDAISLPPTQLLGVEILQRQGKLVLVLPLDSSAKTAAEAKDVALLGTYGPTGFYFKYVQIHPPR